MGRDPLWSEDPFTLQSTTVAKLQLGEFSQMIIVWNSLAQRAWSSLEISDPIKPREQGRGGGCNALTWTEESLLRPRLGDLPGPSRLRSGSSVVRLWPCSVL